MTYHYILSCFTKRVWLTILSQAIRLMESHMKEALPILATDYKLQG